MTEAGHVAGALSNGGTDQRTSNATQLLPPLHCLLCQNVCKKSSWFHLFPSCWRRLCLTLTNHTEKVSGKKIKTNKWIKLVHFCDICTKAGCQYYTNPLEYPFLSHNYLYSLYSLHIDCFLHTVDSFLMPLNSFPFDTNLWDYYFFLKGCFYLFLFLHQLKTSGLVLAQWPALL